MSWDPLLFWMTHMGEGSWTSFRNAVASGVADGDELGDAVRLLSNTLADLGHADFFVGETQYWRINPATLAGLETPPDSAMLIGARTPQMLEMLFDAAEDERCSVTCRNSQSIPTAVYVSGDENSLVRVAASIGIGFVPRFSRKIIGTSEPIQSLFDRAPIESAPTNWRVRSLDFSALSWVDKLLPNSACEYSPRHGRPRWYVTYQTRPPPCFAETRGHLRCRDGAQDSADSVRRRTEPAIMPGLRRPAG